MNEQYFFVHKLGLGKEVVSLSLVVTEVSRGGGILNKLWCHKNLTADRQHLQYCLNNF